MTDEKTTNDSVYAIDARGLTKSFGDQVALKGVHLKIAKGECVAVFGPNGAGKTTLTKMLTTLSKPSDGEVSVGGMDLRKDPEAIRRKVGVVSHQTFLYDNLSALENLKFYGRMYDVPNLKDRINEVMVQVGLEARLNDRVGVFSRGMQQRLSIARAILHDPPILIFDEPETGLDQRAVTILSELLRTLTQGNRTVLMTTHNLEWGAELADRAVILHKGRIVHEESKPGLNLAALRETYYRCTGGRP